MQELRRRTSAAKAHKCLRQSSEYFKECLYSELAYVDGQDMQYTR